jgi:hypothetical protein
MNDKEKNDILLSIFVICIFVGFGFFSSQLTVAGKFLLNIWRTFTC